VSTAEQNEESRVREYDARIKALREARTAVHGRQLTDVEFNGALTTATPPGVATPPDQGVPSGEQRVLDAARSLYGGSGVARPSEIATKMGVEPIVVSQRITGLRKKGAWPYASPLKGRPAGEPMKPKGKSKPNLACLDEPRQASRPAVEDVPAASTAAGVYEAMLAALDAVNALPGEAKAALTLYLSNRSK
jgi:hypothetical protein